MKNCQELVFPSNQERADILGRTDFDFDIFVWIPNFQVPRFPDFRKIGPYSSGDHFSESCAPRKMMQNGIDEIFWGRTFKNTSYFNLRTSEFWVLGP